MKEIEAIKMVTKITEGNKKCSKCKIIKSRDNFRLAKMTTYKTVSGEIKAYYNHRTVCKLCQNKRVIEYQREHPEKTAIRLKTKKAIIQGIIKKENCSVCDTSENLHVHHKDYSNYLDVVWLCKTHHEELHRKERSNYKFKNQ